MSCLDWNLLPGQIYCRKNEAIRTRIHEEAQRSSVDVHFGDGKVPRAGKIHGNASWRNIAEFEELVFVIQSKTHATKDIQAEDPRDGYFPSALNLREISDQELRGIYPQSAYFQLRDRRRIYLRFPTNGGKAGVGKCKS
jgi:hypothetical protein